MSEKEISEFKFLLEELRNYSIKNISVLDRLSEHVFQDLGEQQKAPVPIQNPTPGILYSLKVCNPRSIVLDPKKCYQISFGKDRPANDVSIHVTWEPREKPNEEYDEAIGHARGLTACTCKKTKVILHAKRPKGERQIGHATFSYVECDP